MRHDAYLEVSKSTSGNYIVMLVNPIGREKIAIKKTYIEVWWLHFREFNDIPLVRVGKAANEKKK